MDGRMAYHHCGLVGRNYLQSEEQGIERLGNRARVKSETEYFRLVNAVVQYVVVIADNTRTEDFFWDGSFVGDVVKNHGGDAGEDADGQGCAEGFPDCR